MRRRTAMALVLALSLGACTRAETRGRELALDLKGYVAELKKWEPREKAVFQAIGEVERSQYVDDEFVARTLKAALPDVEQHVREIAVYRPKTRDLSDVHERYRKGWEDLKVALDAIVSAVEAKDYVALARAKTQMVEARRGLLKALQNLDTMLEENEQDLKDLQKS